MGGFSSFKPSSSRWTIRYALIWAAVPFALGVTIGVMVRRSDVADSRQVRAGALHGGVDSVAHPAPVTPDRLRQMADKQAEPLLAQLQFRPNDPELLSKLGYVYFVSRNFQQASTYFKRAVDIKDDAIVRTELGRAYYYAGDPDDALAEFERVLRSDPENVNALFNVGMVKWQSQFDVEGALAAWQQILRKHPNHPRRAELEQLIARAQQHRAVKVPLKSDHSAN
jgi:cytochrome c-type biogenesis protein CcmH/NrfG